MGVRVGWEGLEGSRGGEGRVEPGGNLWIDMQLEGCLVSCLGYGSKVCP